MNLKHGMELNTLNLYNLIDRLKEAAAQTDVLSEDKPYIYFEGKDGRLTIVDTLFIDEEGDIILKEEN